MAAARSTSQRLDDHDAVLSQIQIQMGEVQLNMDSLHNNFQKAEQENAAFRKQMLAWMNRHEKHTSSAGIEGSGSGLVFPPPSPPHPDQPFTPVNNTPDPPLFDQKSSGLPWSVKKIKLPEFNGFDPQGWIQKATLFFDINGTPPQFRLRLAQLSMVGVAQHWFTIVLQLHPSLSWEQFQEELLQRFSGLEVQNPYIQLARIQQSDSILEYIDDFEYLLSLVPKLPERQAIRYFVAGLQDDVHRWFCLQCSRMTMEAMYVAKDVEDLLRPMTGNVSQTRFRYLNRFGVSNGFFPESTKVLGPSPTKEPITNKWGTKPISGQGEITCTPVNPKSFTAPSLGVGKLGNRDRGICSLTRTEWEERRKKGLCFRCGLQYGPAHKCAEGQLRVLLLGDDEDINVIKDQLLLMDSSIPDSPAPEIVPEGWCSAFEFVRASKFESGGQTLKFEGALQGIPIILLFDSGATHNFISKQLVESLNFTTDSFSGIRIKLGDGFMVHVTERCLNLSITIGLCVFLITALVLDTGSTDLIL